MAQTLARQGKDILLCEMIALNLLSPCYKIRHKDDPDETCLLVVDYTIGPTRFDEIGVAPFPIARKYHNTEKQF